MITISVPNKTLKSGYLLKTERDCSQESFLGNDTMGVIWFLLRCTFLVLKLKNTASTFPEIFFIQYFTIIVVTNFMTLLLF